MADIKKLIALLPRDKHDYERLNLLIETGMPDIRPVIPELLEWMQDYNWPIARRLAPFIIQIADQIVDEISRVLQSNDAAWKFWIMHTILEELDPLRLSLFNASLAQIKNQSADDHEWEVAETAQSLLASLD